MGVDECSTYGSLFLLVIFYRFLAVLLEQKSRCSNECLGLSNRGMDQAARDFHQWPSVWIAYSQGQTLNLWCILVQHWEVYKSLTNTGKKHFQSGHTWKFHTFNLIYSKCTLTKIDGQWNRIISSFLWSIGTAFCWICQSSPLISCQVISAHLARISLAAYSKGLYGTLRLHWRPNPPFIVVHSLYSCANQCFKAPAISHEILGRDMIWR